LEAAWPAIAGALFAVGKWSSDKLIAPAIVAVVFSGLTAFLMERWKTQRDQLTKVCDALRMDLQVLQQLAGEYWGKKGADPLAEARILSLQNEILQTLAVLREEFSMTVGTDEDSVEFIDAVTGGDFKTRGRLADPERVQRSAVAISTLRLGLVRERTRRARRTGG
jgi:hypothetical protein